MSSDETVAEERVHVLLLDDIIEKLRPVVEERKANEELAELLIEEEKAALEKAKQSEEYKSAADAAKALKIEEDVLRSEFNQKYREVHGRHLADTLAGSKAKVILLPEGASVSTLKEVEVTNPEQIPRDYTKVDTAALKKSLAAGGEIPGAQLQLKYVVRIGETK